MALADIIECTIDFEGQRLAEQFTHILLIASGIVSFVVGYYLQSLQMVMMLFAGGLVLTALVAIPPWPMYNKHPQPFITDKVVEKKE
ncbi:microsomal signal peptidase 12 kDa subunit-domain-containing protein [Helicostylum pulchrum]|uniref:Signal peptidase complex subunit 1 n=1 Tax=Helicostylum pulchrum TaxID=562976 RepID=A0ABP9XLZ9_9FUNG|nr:microsomal signal peptidase 12 kDa subunit-domain-containing protein [Helicostylum pulchrum]